jgi:cytochrome o ubiquinol oxidase operon protein cyoD
MNEASESSGNLDFKLKRAYITGFVLSLILTLTAWLIVRRHFGSGGLYLTDKVVLITILVLALIQLGVQLAFFLHLFSESKPRWNLTVLSFALIVLLILVLGSLWIMYSLDYRHARNKLPPAELDKSIIEDEGIEQ